MMFSPCSGHPGLPKLMIRPTLLASVVVLIAYSCVEADPPATEKIDVQVLAILVSENHKEVHPKLVAFAKLVQVKEPNLTGFKLELTTADPLELGKTKSFPLVDQKAVEVTVNKDRNEKGRIMLTITPPGLNQITYECACNKFFSMATQHYVGKGKDRQQLFIAIMASPCGGKK